MAQLYVISQGYPLWIARWYTPKEIFDDEDELVAWITGITGEDIAKNVIGPHPVIGWEYEERCVPQPIVPDPEDEGQWFVGTTPEQAVELAVQEGKMSLMIAEIKLQEMRAKNPASS